MPVGSKRKIDGETFKFFSTYNHTDAKKKVKDLKREFPSIRARVIKGKSGTEVYTRRK